MSVAPDAEWVSEAISEKIPADLVQLMVQMGFSVFKWIHVTKMWGHSHPGSEQLRHYFPEDVGSLGANITADFIDWISGGEARDGSAERLHALWEEQIAEMMVEVL